MNDVKVSVIMPVYNVENYVGRAIESIQKNIINIVKNYGDNVGFLPIFGIYKASDKTISVKDMYDKALSEEEKKQSVIDEADDMINELF